MQMIKTPVTQLILSQLTKSHSATVKIVHTTPLISHITEAHSLSLM